MLGSVAFCFFISVNWSVGAAVELLFGLPGDVFFRKGLISDRHHSAFSMSLTQPGGR